MESFTRMSKRIVIKTRKGVNWAEKILNYLRENPFGLTVSQIAEDIDTSRVTVYKYMDILEEQGKVFAREVHRYKLYYSSDRIVLPLNFVSAFYNGILSGLKKKFSNEKEFKELGYTIADVMRVELIKQFPKSIRDEIKTFKDFLRYFPKLYPYLDIILNDNLIIDEDISEDGTKALFHFKNLNLLNLSEDFKYHYYILTGMMEKSLSRIFRKEIQVDIFSLDFENKSVKILLEEKK